MPRRDPARRFHDQELAELLPLATRLARWGGAGQASEDIAQEALLALLASTRTIRDPRSWLGTVVRRATARHFAERRRRTALALSLPPPPNRYPFSLEEHIMLREAGCRLSPRDRAILNLKLRGMSYEEIAERTGIATDSVGTSVSRAFRRVRRILCAGVPSPTADDPAGGLGSSLDARGGARRNHRT